MTVKALMPVPILNLVAPLPHEGTAMHTTDTAGHGLARSGAVSQVIGQGLRQGDVDSATQHSTRRPVPGIRTSTTATRTTTTRAMKVEPEPSADSDLFEQLVVAHADCQRNKRNSKSAMAFEAHLERNLIKLHDELISGTYRPGRSICFVITRPKPREVWAADFTDRIVHHLLYNKIAPRFHAAFTADSCACIPGRGTLYAAKRLEDQVRSVTQNWSKPAHYLKCDLANFFVSIQKSVLLRQLALKVTEPWWMALATMVLMHDPREDVEVRGRTELLRLVPPHKSLFNAPASQGLPIGNLSSQFFANVLLNDLDQHVKHKLRAPHYVRYVDDFLLVHTSTQWLNSALSEIEAWLPERLQVRLNPSKTIIQPVDRGVDFVGHVIKPWRRTTRPRTLRVALQRIETMPADELFAVGNSYLGLLSQASHSHTDRARVANALLARGHCVKSDLSKIYRRATK
jgi:RNA-directed DNA polymerase